MIGPTLDEAVEWRIPIWAPAVGSALERAVCLIPPDAIVLEVGYNTGMMSCYMARHHGWEIIGYDIQQKIRAKAVENAKKYGLQDRIEFRVCKPRETLSIEGQYDAVFIKSVLYQISDKNLYQRWLDWLHSVVRDGGVVIAIENGRGGLLDRFYRKIIRQVRWADFLLFDTWTEGEFRRIFRHVDVEYFGRVSQFFTPLPKACKAVQVLERRFIRPSANKCFIASIVAQK